MSVNKYASTATAKGESTFYVALSRVVGEGNAKALISSGVPVDIIRSMMDFDRLFTLLKPIPGFIFRDPKTDYDVQVARDFLSAIKNLLACEELGRYVDLGGIPIEIRVGLVQVYPHYILSIPLSPSGYRKCVLENPGLYQKVHHLFKDDELYLKYLENHSPVANKIRDLRAISKSALYGELGISIMWPVDEQYKDDLVCLGAHNFKGIPVLEDIKSSSRYHEEQDLFCSAFESPEFTAHHISALHSLVQVTGTGTGTEKVIVFKIPSHHMDDNHFLSFCKFVDDNATHLESIGFYRFYPEVNLSASIGDVLSSPATDGPINPFEHYKTKTVELRFMLRGSEVGEVLAYLELSKALVGCTDFSESFIPSTFLMKLGLDESQRSALLLYLQS